MLPVCLRYGILVLQIYRNSTVGVSYAARDSVSDSWVLHHFRIHAPNALLVGLTRGVRVATAATAGRIAQAVREGELSHSAARDLFPIERRARVETELKGLPDLYPGVLASTRPQFFS